MKGRIKLDLPNNIKDLESMDPHLFDDLSCGQNRQYSKNSEIKSNSTENFNQKNKLRRKRISLEENLFDQHISSAKEQLRSKGFSENQEKSNMSDSNQIIQKIMSKETNHTRTLTIKRKNKLQLKDIIKRQKINNIFNKFIEKIKRNNPFSTAVDYCGFQKEEKHTFLLFHGLQVSKIIDNFYAFLSIIQIASLFIAYTLMLVFPQVSHATYTRRIQTFSLVFYLFQIIYNSVTVKSNTRKKMITLEQILCYYASTSMFVDLVSFTILVIDFNVHLSFMKYLRLFIFAKLPQCLQKMDKLQAFFIKNYYNDQYWSLVKVVLFNFCFAHILAILLTSMTNISSHSNWQIIKGIYHSDWYQRYIWSYYWGTTIMLTIGFGDIVASTYQEAMCLIVIQIISVMCLAYNINSVGALINNIRSQDIEKGKNYKTFKQLSDKYNLPTELEWKINHYIEESVNIRKKFNLEEENHFLQKLPPDLKREYLKESNRSIFYNITFFGNLMDKTLYALAENIEMSISHPQQTLRRLEDEYNLLILRQGQIGFTSKKRNCSFNDMIIDRVKASNSKRSYLLGLQFLTRQRSSFQIKSLEYSVIYSLQYNKLIGILKESQMDYHHFCFQRDKNKTIVDQFEVFPCEYCPDKHHTKFTCPKLHYIPLKQMIIYRQHFRERTGRTQRNNEKGNRIFREKINSLLNHKIISKRPEFPQKASSRTKTTGWVDRINKFKKMNFSVADDSLRMARVDELLLKNASEVIKSEFNQFRMAENFEDEVWSIDCDRMRNFRYYFPEDNPINLGQNFSVEERLKYLCTNFESSTFIMAKSPSTAIIERSQMNSESQS